MLRDIANGPARAGRGAAAELELAEQYLQQRGLAGAVGPEDRDELTGLHRQVEVVPEHAIAKRKSGVGDREDVVGVERHDASTGSSQAHGPAPSRGPQPS